MECSSNDADRDLERRIVNYLARRHLPGLRQLEVRANNGTVTLRGQVRSFYEKQLGQHCCQRVAGVRKLVDAIDVIGFGGSISPIAT
jgi:osmotically-inducible protein OsmY